jgi:ElaB/YqjD/DUF883 family membrane-anchored ribosome-binding protein
MTQQDTSGADALAAELRRIVEQAEQLMAAAGAENVTLGGLKDRVNETIEAAREKLTDLQQEARERGRSVAVGTESWIRSNPWPAVAISVGVGLIIGALLMRGGPSETDDSDEPEL